MTTCSVKAPQQLYTVLIGDGLLAAVGDAVRDALPDAHRVLVISDETVAALYSRSVLSSLQSAGISTVLLKLPVGEKQKRLAVIETILETAATAHLTRKDAFLALGGGVVSDIVGCAASLYLRGVAYVTAATTLLSMIDAAIGGKTGVDLSCGKNLCGTFHHPSLVIEDLKTLSTLPTREYHNGMAEYLKYAMIFDQELIDTLPNEDTIARCVDLKAKAVARDPYDRGERRLLNFGHTVGHALEIVSDYTLSHGEAVAIGMAVMTRSTGDRRMAVALETALRRHSLPIVSSLPLTAVLNAIRYDKKTTTNGLALVLPETVGKAVVRCVSFEQADDMIKAGWEPCR